MTSKNGKLATKIVHRFRCAIYTRKSTEGGLEQEFNSLDAQRESGEAFVKSQAPEGWQCLPDRYDGKPRHTGFGGGRRVSHASGGNAPAGPGRTVRCRPDWW